MDIKKIKTGTTALYKQNLISYSPKYDHYEMIFGTNTTKYQNAKITLQKKETWEIGIVEIDGEIYYKPERLFIELNKFALESTVKAEAYQNLLKAIDPDETKRIYELLKRKRRGLDHQKIEEFLNQNHLYIKEKVKTGKDKKTLLREYIMALVSRKEIPISLIKGGSSVELFTSINRATLDIDAHTQINSIPEIINFLMEKSKDIYFKLFSEEELKLLSDIERGLQTKKVVTFKLIPISKGGTLKEELKGIVIPVSFNTTYSASELREIIKTYKIAHKSLKHLSNASCIVFTREMLLAEKFQSIISKPSSSIKTKYLIDLKLLWSDEIDFTLFKKWLFKKWKNQEHSLNKDQAKEMINRNKQMPLTKIENNYQDAISMYDLDIPYEECMQVYQTLIMESLK